MMIDKMLLLYSEIAVLGSKIEKTKGACLCANYQLFAELLTDKDTGILICDPARGQRI